VAVLGASVLAGQVAAFVGLALAELIDTEYADECADIVRHLLQLRSRGRRTSSGRAQSRSYLTMGNHGVDRPGLGTEDRGLVVGF
jgi:hypothetical protein